MTLTQADTGNHPYPCGWCEKTFSRSDSVKRHHRDCSMRSGNPTGATHLSNSQSHSRGRNPQKQVNASSTGSIFSIASHSDSAFYANGSSATVLAGVRYDELSFPQFAAGLLPGLVGTGDGATMASAMGPAVLRASPYESSERLVAPRTCGAASACMPEACGEGSAAQDTARFRQYCGCQDPAVEQGRSGPEDGGFGALVRWPCVAMEPCERA